MTNKTPKHTKFFGIEFFCKKILDFRVLFIKLFDRVWGWYLPKGLKRPTSRLLVASPFGLLFCPLLKKPAS